MNKENPWGGMVNAEVVEDPMKPFAMNKVKKGLEIMKNDKASGPTGVVEKHLAGKQVILQIANETLYIKDMPHDWKTSTVVPIYKKKSSVMDCASYQGVKILEHGMKVVKTLLEKRGKKVSESLPNAIWFYAWQKPSGSYFYS